MSKELDRHFNIAGSLAPLGAHADDSGPLSYRLPAAPGARGARDLVIESQNAAGELGVHDTSLHRLFAAQARDVLPSV